MNYFLIVGVLAICVSENLEFATADTPGFLDNFNLDFLANAFGGGRANPQPRVTPEAGKGGKEEEEHAAEEEEEEEEEPESSGNFRTRLASILEIGRAFLLNGIPHKNESVSIDPVKLPDVQDPVNREPQWSISGIQLSGLLGLQVQAIKFTDRTFTAEVSFPTLGGQVDLNVMDAKYRPKLALEVDRPRVLVTAEYQFTPHGGFRVANVVPVFLNRGVAVKVKDVSHLASWNPQWDRH